MADCNDFGFQGPININIPPDSITGDMIASGAIKDRHINSDAQIDLSKIKNLVKILNTKLSTDGTGGMLSNLNLNNFKIVNLDTPQYPTDAVTKQYVDDLIQGFGIGYTPVNKAGDSMSGFLTLNADPINPLHASTKQYVDNKLNNLGSGGDTFKGGNNVFTGVNTFNNNTLFNSLVSITNGLQIIGSLSVNGQINLLTGSSLILGRTPTLPLEATTKQYVDDLVSTSSGGDVYTNQNNTFLGANTFNNNVNIGNSVGDTLNVISSSTFMGPVQSQGSLTATGSTNLNTLVVSSTSVLNTLTANTVTINNLPTNLNHATTKQYVDNLVNSLISNPIITVQTPTNLPLTAQDGTLAFVKSIPAIYVYSSVNSTWYAYKIFYSPDWSVIGTNVVEVETSQPDFPTPVNVTPAGTTRFYLYRRGDSQIDVTTIIPDIYFGNWGTIQSAGDLNYFVPYIGSVVSNGSSLRKEYKVSNRVFCYEQPVISNPNATNTSFLPLNVSAFLPSTSNNIELLIRLITPASSGANNFEIYTRPTGNTFLSSGKLTAGNWTATSGPETGTYTTCIINTNDSKSFDYRFNRGYTTPVNFYYNGYLEVI